MNCSNCGAPMRLLDGRDCLTCDYCHSEYLPERNEDGVRVLDDASELSCPVCAVPLEHAVLEAHQILYCTRCRGSLIPGPVFVLILRDLRAAPLRGVCHHFSGSIDIARQVLDCGLLVSFCGPLTYPHSRRLKEAARFVPLDRVLTETDAPDLPPWGHRGELSLPWHVEDVLKELAALHAKPVEEVALQVEANFRGIVS